MARVIDITDKLNFEEKPKIAIKGQEFEVDDSATTFLKLIQMEKDDSDRLDDVYELLFDKATRNKIDKLKLNMRDFAVMIKEAIKAANGKNNNQGENQTPATT